MKKPKSSAIILLQRDFYQKTAKVKEKMSRASIIESIKAFYQISGMEISLVDEAHNTALVSCRCPYENLCQLLHRSSECLEVCRESDRVHLALAKGGEQVIYTCPFGVREVILPIRLGEEIDGHIFCSMGISELTTPSEIATLVKSHTDYAFTEEELEGAIQAMPRLTQQTEEAYLRILEILSEHIQHYGGIGGEKIILAKLIKAYIRDNLRRKITLADLSWSFHCSTVTITQHFKAEYGITITEYITKKRMQLAEELLLSTTHPLHKIAEKCGYPDVEYFSRTFKKTHGTPPGKWREERRGRRLTIEN